ncbi:hypothetical protein BDV11DRAFT_210640 [Aspergillus similis]
MVGYGKLAALMTGDKGLSIFRSFKMLNTKNLLFLQAEIAIKEKGYREKYSSSVRFLKGMDEPSEQWRKWLEIRELLEKYNMAFAQHAQLLRLRPPHKRDLDTFRDWLGDNPICAIPVECQQWFGENDEERGDLVALSGRYENVDLLTNWHDNVVSDTASSMLVLYLVNNMITRLIIIVVYNIGFSIIIGLLAKARRVEVFAASTAFAAVQVAFITNFPRN